MLKSFKTATKRVRPGLEQATFGSSAWCLATTLQPNSGWGRRISGAFQSLPVWIAALWDQLKFETQIWDQNSLSPASSPGVWHARSQLSARTCCVRCPLRLLSWCLTGAARCSCFPPWDYSRQVRAARQLTSLPAPFPDALPNSRSFSSHSLPLAPPPRLLAFFSLA